MNFFGVGAGQASFHGGHGRREKSSSSIKKEMPARGWQPKYEPAQWQHSLGYSKDAKHVVAVANKTTRPLLTVTGGWCGSLKFVKFSNLSMVERSNGMKGNEQVVSVLNQVLPKNSPG